MTRIGAAITAILVSGITIFAVGTTPASADGTGRQQLNPCAVPNEIVGSVEETAWRIWVAATCPVNKDHYPYCRVGKLD